MSAFGGCTYRGIPLHSFRIADDSPTIPLPEARSVILKFVKGQRNDLLFSEPMTCYGFLGAPPLPCSPIAACRTSSQ